MLEIYNEQVRDLLQKSNPKGGLSVRQNPKLGLFYVEKLKKVAVESYEEIERRSEEGFYYYHLLDQLEMHFLFAIVSKCIFYLFIYYFFL